MRAHEIFNEASDNELAKRSIIGKSYYFFAYDVFINEDVLKAIVGPKEVKQQMRDYFLKDAHLEMKSWITIRPGGVGVKGRVWKLSEAAWRRLETAYDIMGGGWEIKKQKMDVGTLNPLGEDVNFFSMSPKAYQIRYLAIPSKTFEWPSKNFVGGIAYKQLIRDALTADTRTLKSQYNEMPGWDPRKYPPISAQEKRMIDLLKPEVQERIEAKHDEIVSKRSNEETVPEDGDVIPDLNEGIFDKEYYYFGYGANANKTQFLKRCKSAKFVGVGKLVGWRLEFRSFANITPDPSSSVQGVVWKLSVDDVSKLDHYEGATDNPPSYNRLAGPMQLLKNGIVQRTLKDVVYYTMSPEAKTIRKPADPKPSYLARLIAGYQAHGVDTSQVAKAMPKRMKNGKLEPVYPRIENQEIELRKYKAGGNAGGGKEPIEPGEGGDDD